MTYNQTDAPQGITFENTYLHSDASVQDLFSMKESLNRLKELLSYLGSEASKFSLSRHGLGQRSDKSVFLMHFSEETNVMFCRPMIAPVLFHTNAIPTSVPIITILKRSFKKLLVFGYFRAKILLLSRLHFLCIRGVDLFSLSAHIRKSCP